jgi:hypothetical protein
VNRWRWRPPAAPARPGRAGGPTAGGGPDRSPAAQGVGAASLPAGMPVADPLAGDAELVGGLGLADASGEQLSGAQPAGLESFACLLGRSLAGSGSHALILPQRETSADHPSIRRPVRPRRGSRRAWRIFARILPFLLVVSYAPLGRLLVSTGGGEELAAHPSTRPKCRGGH